MKETKKLKEELKTKAIKEYGEIMEKSINGEVTENDIWLIGGIVNFVVDQLNKKKLLK